MTSAIGSYVFSDVCLMKVRERCKEKKLIKSWDGGGGGGGGGDGQNSQLKLQQISYISLAWVNYGVLILSTLLRNLKLIVLQADMTLMYSLLTLICHLHTKCNFCYQGSYWHLCVYLRLSFPSDSQANVYAPSFTSKALWCFWCTDHLRSNPTLCFMGHKTVTSMSAVAHDHVALLVMSGWEMCAKSQQIWQKIWRAYLISMVSCQKGPTRHSYAWQIGPFWQDTLAICLSVKYMILL